MQLLRVEMLGPARVLYGGDLYPYKAPPKCLPLMGYLLLHRNAALSRESLAYSMWPDHTEQQARANLRRHLHRLAQALPAQKSPWFETDTVSVRWVAPIDFDVDEFLAASVGDNDLEMAVRIYRGEFLDGVFEDWIFPERERLRAHQIENYNRLISRAQSDRAYDRATGYAKALLSLDPWRENTLRTLMALRQASGDRAGAVAEFEDFSKRLEVEMGTAPMPETAAAYEAALRGDPIETTEAVDPPSNAPRIAALLPFAGRTPELERLLVPWGRAARGHGSTIILGGEAGVGKTRLTQELAALASAQGALVLAGATMFPETQPYQAVIELLRDALPVLLDSPIANVWLSVLSLLLPQIRTRRPEIEPPQPVEASRERARLFESVAAALTALAKRRPLLVIVEDIHWAGNATLDLVDSLARLIPSLGCLLVVTYREEEVDRAHAARKLRRALERDAVAAHLSVPRLDEDAVHEIAVKCFGPEVSAAMARRLFRQSEGNPLFLSQAVRNTLDGIENPVLDAESAIATNVGRLSERALSAAQSASVLGRAFDVEILRELGKWNEGELLRALDELLDRAIVREASATYRNDYAFSHNLIQTYVYSTLEPARALREHRRAAGVLRDLYGEDAATAGQIAQHFEKAGAGEDAAPFYVAAATHSESLFANDEAVAFAERASALTTDPHVDFEAAALREEIHARMAMRSEQRKDLEDMRVAASRIASGTLLADTQRRLVRLLHALGEREAEAEAIVAFEELGKQANGMWPAEAAYARGLMEMANGHLEVALERANAAAALFAHDERAIPALCLAAEIQAARGRFDEAIALLEGATQAAHAADNMMLLMRCHYSAGIVEFSRRNFKEALANGIQLLNLCEQAGDKQGAANAHARIASSYARLFDYDAAERNYALAAELYERIRDRQGEAIVLLNAATLQCGFGELERALENLSRSRELFETLGDLRGQALSYGNLAYVLRCLGRLEEAAQAGYAGLDLALQLGSPAVEAHIRGNIGSAFRDLGKPEPALDQLRQAFDIRLRMEPSADFAEDGADLALALLIKGDLREAQAIIAQVESRNISVENAWYPQDCWWIIARVRSAAGDIEGYKEAVTRAGMLLEERMRQIKNQVRAQRYAATRYNAEILAAFDSIKAG
ncbi:MAG: AAA family ATPase [Candidatus Baltobacteraceae bacterium]